MRNLDRDAIIYHDSHTLLPILSERERVKIMQEDIRKYESKEPSENKIAFLKDWNGKISKGIFFTTIRKPDKFIYYESRIGETFDVILNDKFISKAVLRDATLTSLEKITPELLVLDTGTMDWKVLFEKFHVIDKCVLLLFERIE